MILALDCATRTGYACGGPGPGLVESGAVSFPPKPSHARRLWSFRNFLRSRLDDTPSLVIYETPFLHMKHRSGCLVGAGMEAVLLVECYSRGIAVTGVAPSALKKHATGKGNAKKVDMAVAMLDRWPGVVPSDDNEVDALALLAMAIDGASESVGL